MVRRNVGSVRLKEIDKEIGRLWRKDYKLATDAAIVAEKEHQ